VRVAVVAEYYPRLADPVLGIWAHRQALAARNAGADVQILVLHRVLPSRAALRNGDLGSVIAPLRQPLRAELDGLRVQYVPFVSPPRSWSSSGSIGAWATPSLAIALRVLRRSFPFDLVHAHYAAPAGDAVRRSKIGVPFVVSVHGGDVYSVARESTSGERAVKTALATARLVLANSQGIEGRCKALGARRTRVVHLGTDLPVSAEHGESPQHRQGPPVAPRIATVANLVDRKRHADVLRAMWLLREAEPRLRWLVVGDGPQQRPLEHLARELGLADRVEFRGALPHDAAVGAARSADVFVLPSLDEAFGVAYIEAMAGAVPAIGCRGEPGPEELARLGGGIVLVPPADPDALAAELLVLLRDQERRGRLGARAFQTVAEHFTWQRCGSDTLAAYGDALSG
jgi:teichuronic acid biosynthesis glycosyltransferase TuaC